MVGGGKCEDGKEIERIIRGRNRGVESVRRKWEELAVKVAFVYVLYGSIEKKTAMESNSGGECRRKSCLTSPALDSRATNQPRPTTRLSR